MKVEAPSSGIGKKVAELSGIWQGSDERGRQHAIVIESITPEGVKGISSWGGHERTAAGWIRMTGKVESEAIIFTWEYPPQPKAVLTLKPKDDKNAFAEFSQGSDSFKAWLNKK
jgi:hypothetical protein